MEKTEACERAGARAPATTGVENMPNERDELMKRRRARAGRGPAWQARQQETIPPGAWLWLVATAIVVTLVVGSLGVLLERIIHGAADEGSEDLRACWTGVVDRVEADKAVVIPFDETQGASTPGGDAESLSEVVMPLYLLPRGSNEGAVLDFATTVRPGETRARIARTEALIRRLKDARARNVASLEAATRP